MNKSKLGKNNTTKIIHNILFRKLMSSLFDKKIYIYYKSIKLNKNNIRK